MSSISPRALATKLKSFSNDGLLRRAIGRGGLCDRELYEKLDE
jgi:DNA-binding HxlR family transcriptional regulator